MAGQRHWQVLAPGPLHREGGGVLSFMLRLRLGMETTVEGPPGQGWHLCCPLDSTLPFQTRLPLPSPLPPLAVESPQQRQHTQSKGGPGEPPASPKIRGHSPLGQLDTRPCLYYNMAPNLSDTHVETHHKSLLTVTPAKLEGGSRGALASLRATDPPGQHGTGCWHLQWARYTKARS